MCVDAGRVQIGADPEAGPQGEARHDAAVHPEAAQDADEVPGAAVAQEQHEDHVGHLPESAPPARRRLGLRQWLADCHSTVYFKAQQAVLTHCISMHSRLS